MWREGQAEMLMGANWIGEENNRMRMLMKPGRCGGTVGFHRTRTHTHTHTRAQAHQWAVDYFLVRMVVPGTKLVENPCKIGRAHV